MEPEIYSPRPGVVNKSCLYACLFGSVLSSPMDASLFPHVAFDSSMARIPRPGDAIDFYLRGKQKQLANIGIRLEIYTQKILKQDSIKDLQSTVEFTYVISRA